MRPVFALAAAALLAPLGAGCAEPPPPTFIEVYVEPSPPANSTAGVDGERVERGTCDDSVQYVAHVLPSVGTATVTVTDGAGATSRMQYTQYTEEDRPLPGAAGNWTLHVAWDDFAGAIHASLVC